MPLIDSSHSSPGKDEKPCRTCVDFKTWAKAQRKSTKKADDTNKISGEIVRFFRLILKLHYALKFLNSFRNQRRVYRRHWKQMSHLSQIAR